MRYREKNVAAYLKKAVFFIERQIEWVERQLLAEKNIPACPFKKQTLSQTRLQWTSPKAYLIELMYALDAACCFDSGNTSLNRIAVYFEEVFNIDLSHFARDFYEMRIRNNRTPLIDKLKKLIVKRMDNPKKPYKN
jgi:hypothetical protein